LEIVLKQNFLIRTTALVALALTVGSVAAYEDADDDYTGEPRRVVQPKSSSHSMRHGAKPNTHHADSRPQGQPDTGPRQRDQTLRQSMHNARPSAAANATGVAQQSQTSMNSIAAGNHNGNVRNSGNNTGNSSSRSNATNASTQSNKNSSSGNTTSTRVEGDTYIQQASPRSPVSSAIAPALANGNDTCVGSTSMGAQGLTFGASFGHQWTDENCVMLKNATLLWNMGKQDAALALLCGSEKIREALEMSGTECPQTAKRRAEATRVRYDASDPYIAARIRRSQEDADPFANDANGR
jgi:hypothetical protein